MKRIVAITLLLSTFIGCCACQPTPEKTAVQSKANGELERKLAADPVEAAYGKLPESINEKIDGKQKEVTIYVNAEVKAPPVVQIPVKEYVSDEISEDDLQKYTEYFFGGSEPYMASAQLTKSQLAECIKTVETELNENRLNEYYGDNEAMKNEVREIKTTEYNMLKQFYKDAPETITREHVEYRYIPQNDYMDQATYAREYASAAYMAKRGVEGAKEALDSLEHKYKEGDENYSLSFRCLAEMDEGYTGYVCATRRSAERTKGTSFEFRRGKAANEYGPYEVQDRNYMGTRTTMSEESAQKIADEALKATGKYDEYELETYSYENPEENEATFHYFRYRRKLADGIYAVDYFLNLAPSSDVRYEETRQKLDAEEIQIWVDDDGIAQFCIDYPLKEIQTVNTSVELMKFEDVYDIFKQYSVLHYDNIEGITEEEDGSQYIQYADETEIRIKEIYLAGIRIVKKNDINRYLYVPVWIFKGTKKNTFTLGSDVNTVTDITSVIVNAIDGTIINPNDCY